MSDWARKQRNRSMACAFTIVATLSANSAITLMIAKPEIFGIGAAIWAIISAVVAIGALYTLTGELQ